MRSSNLSLAVMAALSMPTIAISGMDVGGYDGALDYIVPNAGNRKDKSSSSINRVSQQKRRKYMRQGRSV